MKIFSVYHNPIALRKAEIVYNFGLSVCNRVKRVNFIVCFYSRIFMQTSEVLEYKCQQQRSA